MPDDGCSTPPPAPSPRRVAIAAALVALVAAIAAGRAGLAAAEDDAPVSVKAAPLKVAAGEEGELRVTLTPGAGLALLAPPAPNTYTTPVTLILQAAGGIAPLQPAYPKGTPVMEEGGFPYNQYETPIIVRVPVKVTVGAAPGAHVLKGTLRYQAIRHGSFMKTAVLPVAITVEVTVAKKKPSGKGKQAAPAPETPAAPATRP